jgi:hypothetical protein
LPTNQTGKTGKFVDSGGSLFKISQLNHYLSALTALNFPDLNVSYSLDLPITTTNSIDRMDSPSPYLEKKCLFSI